LLTLFNPLADYIKSGEGEHANRRIFYGTPLDKFEMSKIRELEEEIRNQYLQLPLE